MLHGPEEHSSVPVLITSLHHFATLVSDTVWPVFAFSSPSAYSVCYLQLDLSMPSMNLEALESYFPLLVSEGSINQPVWPMPGLWWRPYA